MAKDNPFERRPEGLGFSSAFSESPSLQNISHHLSAIAAEHERLHTENLKLRTALTGRGPESWSSLDEEEALGARWHRFQPTALHAAPPKPEPERGSLRASVQAAFGNGEEAVAGVAGGPRKSVQDKGAVFNTAGDMKAAVRSQLMAAEVYDVKNCYWETGFCQDVARKQSFENVTMAVIAVYALWMGVDTDYNDAKVLVEADPVFQVAENIFCLYFFAELIIRFGAFKRKFNCLKDAWFVFDTLLVTTMVLETWVLSIALLASPSSGGASNPITSNMALLRIARLMRLSRLLRMARLLRMLPELMIMIKAIAQALRSVGFTLFLLIIVLYAFGIAFKQLVADPEIASTFFSTVLLSMQTLFLQGTLLDDILGLTGALFAANELFALLVLYCFVILSGLTIMNMLIGVICEVITAVAAAENEQIQVGFLKEVIQGVLSGVDENGDGLIQREEFFLLLQHPDSISALEEVGVDVVSLVDFVDVIFDESAQEADHPGAIRFPDFMEAILQLRGTNMCTVRDIVDFRKWVTGHFREMVKMDVSEIVGKEVPAKGTTSKVPKKAKSSNGEDHANGHAPPLPGQLLQAEEETSRLTSKDVLN